MSESASTASGIAGRYALALFDLAKEGKGIAGLEADVTALGSALDGSADLRNMITSPVYSRDEQARAIAAVAKKMKLSDNVSKTLALMAQNRRLFALPQLIARLQALIADARGEVTADVVSAVALSDDQKQRLTATLAEKSGKTVKLNTRVDESLIGGMIVRLGSQMIDSSIKSKLASLQNAMKEVG